jgi:hypothetical protein
LQDSLPPRPLQEVFFFFITFFLTLIMGICWADVFEGFLVLLLF